MSIFHQVYNELKAKIEHLPKQYGHYQQAFEALDNEEVSDIIVDNGVFWFEYPLYSELTDQQYALLVNYISNHLGYKHLYSDLTMPSVV
jgi:hypothetical protein